MCALAESESLKKEERKLHLSLQNQSKEKQYSRAVVKCVDAELGARGMAADFGTHERQIEFGTARDEIGPHPGSRDRR
ncbi:hypothetical protein EVAR_21295_1 [Eumeta japonica]|uniref:Uncharacterized protein n=1 Tax=Eumeta variegata TaxID=151549 RepID=A0A4C1WPZ2_EUMVA|nr:hypothetical protein EVAR_21295_1 [Eumeta japonica]